MKNLSLLILLSILIAACKPLIQEVSPERVPQTNRKLVVHCFISPQDTVLSAIVGLSRNVLGIEDSYPNSAAVSNPEAKVVISDGVRSRTIPFDPVSSQHRLKALEFPVEVGKTYTLEVSMPNGMSVTAQTIVPRPIPIHRIQIDSIIEAGYNNYARKIPVLRAFWNDPANETNYYRIESNVSYTNYSIRYTGGGQVGKDTTFVTTNYLVFDNVPYYSDRVDNGKEMSSTPARLGYIVSKPSQWSPHGRISPLAISTALLHMDEAYFKYQNIVREWNNDNPFAEPSLIPTNIKGGLGCFGSYSVRKLSIDFD